MWIQFTRSPKEKRQRFRQKLMRVDSTRSLTYNPVFQLTSEGIGGIYTKTPIADSIQNILVAENERINTSDKTHKT